MLRTSLAALAAIVAASATFTEPPTAAPTPDCSAIAASKPPENDAECLAAGLPAGCAPPPFYKYFGILFHAVIQPIIPVIAPEETPIQIRYTSLIDTINWNCAAAFHGSWKDGLNATRRPAITVPDASTHHSLSRAACIVAANDHFTKTFLAPARPAIQDAAFCFGLVPDPAQRGWDTDAGIASCLDLEAQGRAEPGAFYGRDPSRDDETCLQQAVAAADYNPAAVGQAVAEVVKGYAAADGWNALGDVASTPGVPDSQRECTANCRPFQDTSGYAPRRWSDRKLKRTKDRKQPWEPLLEDTGAGFFYRQEHVTPHIGTAGKFRVTPEAERARTAPKPRYNYEDEATKLIDTLANLNDTQKVEVEFMDDKLNILLETFTVMLGTDQSAPKFASFEGGLAWLLGYTATEHDAAIMVWKEKVAYDLVRPTTWIQTWKGDEDLTTWAGPMRGTQTIKGRDFQPFKRVMPHSEYPSGSACLCRGIKDYVDAHLLATSPATGTALPMTITVPAKSSKVEYGMTPHEDVVLSYADMQAMEDTCGRSRVDGGMHFEGPNANRGAVPAGYDLCDGIGNYGFDFANALIEGDWGVAQQLGPAPETYAPTAGATAAPSAAPATAAPTNLRGASAAPTAEPLGQRIGQRRRAASSAAPNGFNFREALPSRS